MWFLTCNAVLCVFVLYTRAILDTEDWHFTGNNVALNKPTSQSPGTYSETIPRQWPPVTKNYTSNLAVDGNTNTNFSGLSCSCTNGNDEASSWTVRLGQTYFITGIRIYNRKDHHSRLEFFKVLGKSGTRDLYIYEDITNNPRQFNNEVISITMNGRQPFETITILIPKRSRKGEHTFLTLCEVQIFQGSEPHWCDRIITTGFLNASAVPGTGLRTDSKIDVGTVITFTCPPGYVVDGSTAVVCLDTWNYNSTVPKRCKQNGCRYTPPLTNGRYSGVKTLYNNGDTVTAVCNSGFYLQGQSTITCTAGGHWQGTHKCLQITCNNPAAITHGFYSKSAGGGNKVYSNAHELFSFEQRLNVNCDEGYKQSTSVQSRQCTGRDFWNGSQPVCTIVTCQIPTTASNIRLTDNNGRLLHTRIQYGESVRASCTSYQYRLIGSSSRSCGANGTFIGTAPLCVSICDRPVTAKGTYSNNNDQLVQGQSITLVCDYGYKATSSNTRRDCQNNHTWSNSNIQCKQNGCQNAPKLTNGSYNTFKGQFDFGATIQASCNTGYYLQGNHTVTCILPGRWSHTPTCLKITCNYPGTIAHGFYSKSSGRVNSNAHLSFRFNQWLYVNCNKGYKRSGSKQWRRCTGQNSWSGSEPICTRITCRIPASNINIQFTYNTHLLLNGGIQYGETVIASCTRAQYQLTGSQSRSCGTNGVFNGTAPLCEALCERPVTAYGTYSKNNSEFVQGQRITLVCNDGYKATSSNTKRVCQSDHLWSKSNIQCKQNGCQNTPKLTNGSYNTLKVQFDFGATIQASCNTGYYLQGNHTVTCILPGRWSHTPTCLKITCNYPGTIAHGFYSKSRVGGNRVNSDVSRRFRFRQRLYVNCYKGYKRSGSEKWRQCTGQNSWDGSQPTCTRITCQIPYASNIHFTYNKHRLLNDSIQYGETVIANCIRAQYQLAGSQSRSCEANGVFNGTEPLCEAICERPVTAHGTYSKNNSEFVQGQRIALLCNDGYKSTSSNTTRVCQIDHSWSNGDIQCKAKRCNIPPVRNGSYNVTSANIKFPETISFECKKGFKINITGSKTRTCQSNKSMSGQNPVCKEIFCSTKNFNPDNNHYELINYLNNSNKIRYNETIQTTCKEGYERESGSETRTCIDDDKFKETELSCRVIHCSTPPIVFQGTYNITATNLTYLTNISFSCSNGYMQTKGNSTRLCQADQTLSGEEPVCIAIESTSDRQSSQIRVVCGLAVGGVIVVIFIVIGVVLFRRRGGSIRKPAIKRSCISVASPRQVTSNTDSDHEETRETNIDSVNVSEPKPRHPTPYNGAILEHSEQAYYSFSNPDRKPERAIRVADLSDLVLNGDTAVEKFKKEFESLPTGMKEKHTIALKQQNRAKNRYKNLYAYDATRVALDVSDTKSETDYINANYVHGFNKIQAYVASQGATKEMIDDFWRMVWQIDCGKIVMLTNIIEENKEKCKQYWPTSDSMTFGKIEVTLKKTEMFSSFAIRTLAVGQHGNNDVKEILQFHFTAWPDKSVPKYASSLVNFRNKVKHTHCEREGPIVVHCSAGIGRTGTFIALDYLTDQALALGYVDVAGCVETIRKQRVNLVQTLDQYIFIHHALVETLMLSPTAMPAAQFPAAYKEMLEYDDVQKKRKIDIAFEMLKKVSPVADEYQYVSAKHVRNRNKNRYSNILPVAEFMPTLSSTDEHSDSDYINAVFLPSYKVKEAFIITQTPMEYTIHDFWRLLYEHDVQSIVMMNDVTEIKDTEVYWPKEGDEMSFGLLKVTNIGSSEDQLVTTLKINKFEKTRTIKQFRCQNGESSAALPKDSSSMLQLMELVQNWQQQTGNHPVVVHCMNGAERSGLYCVISAVIERMKIEQGVAITQVIEQMRNNREQIISTQEQFQFCHEAVITFMDKYDTYSNFTK